jgi:ketosteroid isomerase-like protein
MSEENVAILRRAFTAALQGDPSAFRQLMEPDVGWDISAHPLPDVPNRGQGRDALIAGWATYLAGWNDYRGEITETIATGDHLVVVVHETARMLHTDVMLDRDLIHLWTLSDGRISFARVFRTTAEALEAAEMSD